MTRLRNAAQKDSFHAVLHRLEIAVKDLQT